MNDKKNWQKEWTLRINGNGLNDMVNDIAKITLAHDDDDDAHTHTHARSELGYYIKFGQIIQYT